MNMNHAVFAEHILNKGNAPIELDLCDLLRSMQLSTGKVHENEVQDVPMPSSPTCSNSEAPTQPSSNAQCGSDELHGCAYLRAIRQQLDSLGTTSGEYLEAIFTHREILSAFPGAHHECARGFSDMASMLEKRACRADRDADTEAVAAFRYEAWSIAASLPISSIQASRLVQNGRSSSYGASYVCVMPAM